MRKDGWLRCARNDAEIAKQHSIVTPRVCGGSSTLRHGRRGRRECRVLAAPAVSCARLHGNAHTSIQVQPGHAGIPCAVVLRLMPGSPRRRIPLASVADELTARLARLGVANLRRLDTSHGCQDHTVLPYASAPYVLRAIVHSRLDTAPRTTSRADAAASTASRPTFVTMANAPLLGTGWRKE
jgi:hypothetical protein